MKQEALKADESRQIAIEDVLDCARDATRAAFQEVETSREVLDAKRKELVNALK
jgi:hypothetical protein